MKTEQLLDALASDPPPAASWRPAAALVAAVPGMLVSLALLLATIGMRSDFPAALANPRIAFKFAFAALFAAAGAALLPDLVRPDGRRRLAPVVGLCLAFVVLAFGTDLAVTDRSAWGQAAWGDGPLACIGLIVALSLPPTALLFLALRRGAPASPALAGAAIGLLGGGTGIAVFALNCANDTAIFVGLWYSLALALVAAAAALAGRRFLAW